MRIKFLNSQKGYALPELLLAAGIVLMISSIVLAGVKAFTEQRKKVNVTLMALSMQSSLQAALQDYDNYPQAVQNVLKMGTEEYKNIEFKSTWTNESSDNRIPNSFFTLGKSVSFDLKKNIYDVNNPKGILRLYTKIRKIAPGTTNSFPLYKVGYRIVFLDSRIPHLGSPLAENQAVDDFSDSDYIETISHDLYMGKSGNDQGKVQCDPAVDIGIHGFSRDTGAPICIEKIYGSAKPKTFPRTIEFVPGYFGENSIALKPHLTLNHVPFRTFTPPNNYIFQRINTHAFDPNGPTSGITYVFVYKKYATFYTGIPLTNWGSVTAKCPTSYYAVARTSGFCSLGETKAVPGRRTVEIPGATPSAPPTYETVEEPPNCGPGSNITYSGGGKSATCTYNPPRCPNGGSFIAKVTVNTSPSDCILTEPETKSP